MQTQLRQDQGHKCRPVTCQFIRKAQGIASFHIKKAFDQCILRGKEEEKGKICDDSGGKRRLG